MRNYSIIAAFIILGLTSCNSPSYQLPNVQASNVPGLDGQFLKYNNDLEGFGGLYYNSSGAAVVYLTSKGDQKKVADYFAPRIQARAQQLKKQWVMTPQGLIQPNSVDAGKILFKNANFDFSTLIQYKALFLHQAQNAGVKVARFDINEHSNRLDVGFLTQEDVDKFRSILSSLKIPTTLYQLEVAEPVTEDLAPIETLSHRYRPIAGGLTIEILNPSGAEAGYCTLMANAIFEGNFGFLTNSHCLTPWGSANNSAVYQKEYTKAARTAEDLIGHEWADAQLIDPYQCGYTSTLGCRYSDAAFVRYDNQVESDTNARRGYIVKPESISPGPIQYMWITGVADQAIYGDSVNKIGATSGWTSGTITNTCEDSIVPESNIMKLCQVRASYRHQGGDSGGPIFTYNGTSATLVGIHWGGNVLTGGFSDMWNLNVDYPSGFNFLP